MSVLSIEHVPTDVVLDVFCRYLVVFDLRNLSRVNRRHCFLFSSDRAWIHLKRAILRAYPQWETTVFFSTVPIRVSIRAYLFPMLSNEGRIRLCALTRNQAKANSFNTSYNAVRAILSTAFPSELEEKCWFFCRRDGIYVASQAMALDGHWWIEPSESKSLQPLQNKLSSILLYTTVPPFSMLQEVGVFPLATIHVA